MNTAVFNDALAAACMLGGLAFLLIAAIGLVRLPDVFCRGHAMGMASTAGFTLLLLGVWLEVDADGVGLKVLLAVLFQFATIPVASHLVGNLALRKRVRRWDGRGWRRGR